MATEQTDERLENARDAINAIESWAAAYPEDQFPPQDLRKADEILRAHGISMGAMHGSWGRHIMSGVMRYLVPIKAALEGLNDKSQEEL